MESEWLSFVEQGLKTFGVESTPASRAAILQHLALVAEWNERINLTAITETREMIVKHALDSASGLKLIQLEPGTRVLDVGTGAGFPGVTWKVLAPGIDLVLLESLQKRCRFLSEVGERVIAPLSGEEGEYQVVWGRAEDVGRMAEHREAYDLVTARAVAELRTLVELCLPFVRVGGQFLAMKGPSVATEVEAAARALAVLGGKVSAIEEFELPDQGGRRSLVLIEKVKRTPSSYPRKAGTPGKSPL